MSSKADVLKRYLGGGGGGGGGADDGSKKKKRKKTDHPAAKVSSYSGLKVVDDEEWGRGPGGGGGLDDDDAPLVVDASDLVHSDATALRGAWTDVDAAAAAAAAAADGGDSDPEPPRRRRHDSDGSDSDSAPPRRPPAAAAAAAAAAVAGRKRHDSDSDPEPPRRNQRRDDDDDNDGDSAPPRRPPPAKTSTGHSAGLQSGEQFREHETRLRLEREAAMAHVDPALAGQGAETVYRDRKGRKLDMLSEFMRQQAVADGKAARIEKAQAEWGRGAVQKESAEQARRELEILADEPFARAADDPRVEALRKQEMREGDPMAEYFASKRGGGGGGEGAGEAGGGAAAAAAAKRKPVYKGPAPPPNRFRILPGYRWDGNDRGNGWESKILKAANSRASLRSDGAAWSMADM